MEKKIVQNTFEAQISGFAPVPIIVLIWALVSKVHNIELTIDVVNVALLIGAIFTLATMLVHEYLHRIGWVIGGADWTQMEIKLHLPLGASIRFLEELPVKTFILGSLFPFIMLSCVPLAIGVLLGNIVLLSIGTMGAVSCGSDLLIVARVLPYWSKTCYDPGITGVVVKL